MYEDIEALKKWRDEVYKFIDKLIARNEEIIKQARELLPDKCEYCDNPFTETLPIAESPDDFINVRVCNIHAEDIKRKNE